MKRMFLALLMALIVKAIYGQSGMFYLTGDSSKTWYISSIEINSERFEDEEGTCLYGTEYTFSKHSNCTVYIPCKEKKNMNLSFSIDISANELLLGKERIKILELNEGILKTEVMSKVTIGEKEESFIAVIIYKPKR